MKTVKLAFLTVAVVGFAMHNSAMRVEAAGTLTITHVDQKAGTVTVRHDETGRSQTFKVSDPKLLQGTRPGQVIQPQKGQLPPTAAPGETCWQRCMRAPDTTAASCYWWCMNR